MGHDELLLRARKINSTGAPIFLDLYNPAYGEMISADAKFSIDSIVPVKVGAPAKFTIRERSGKKVVVTAPFLFARSFTLPELIHDRRAFPKQDLSDHVDRQTCRLKEGEYSIAIAAEAEDGTIVRTREHIFSVGNPVLSRGARTYCVHAYKDLLLREYGSMPCCNLIRNEKMLYNTYASDGYDPWNNEAWQALRQSLREGNPKYCHPTCPSLTSAPVSKHEFVRFGQAVDGSLCKDSWDETERYRAYLDGDIKLNVGPSRLGIMVGTICNIDCIFCPIPYLKNRRTVFTENMLLLLEKHVKTCKRLTFTGGEPLVYIKELRQLEKYFHEDLTVQIITNGIAANHLVNFGNPAHLALRVSLNCANREDYIYLHEKDFFDRIVENIRELKKKRPSVYVSLKFIIMKRTMRDIVKFAELCRDLGVDDCTYTTLWIKTQSTINPREKILGSDPEWFIANAALEEAKQIVAKNGIRWSWTGWDTRPDDYALKSKMVEAQGEDSFSWAEG